jgi:hypothetical protein
MNLKKVLAANKTDIVGKWYQSILSDYPEKTAAVYKNSLNQFANPVGVKISNAVTRLFDEFVNGIEEERVKPIMEEIVRIRAIQNFSPSKSLEFIFRFKGIILKFIEKDIQSENIKELLKIEAEIDRLAQISFDIYVTCRDKLFELKANEYQKRVHMLLKKADPNYKEYIKNPFLKCKID